MISLALLCYHCSVCTVDKAVAGNQDYELKGKTETIVGVGIGTRNVDGRFGGLIGRLAGF